MKHIINEILEEIGLEKIIINKRDAKAHKEPLEVEGNKEATGINTEGDKQSIELKN